MKKVKKLLFFTLTLVCVMGLTFGTGISILADEANPNYNDKLIARYTLDEISEEVVGEDTIYSFAAINNSGVALPDMKATTTASVINNAMEGKGAATFMTGNMRVPAFLGAEDTGFSVSAWFINREVDWDSLVDIQTADGKIIEIGMPNASWFDSTGFVGNKWPDDTNKVNGGQWDSFLNTSVVITANAVNEYMYVTLNFDPVNGLSYYKDGVKLITYPRTTTIGPNTYGDVVDIAIATAKTDGIIIGKGAIDCVDDVRISTLLSDEEIMNLYANVSSLNISEILENGAFKLGYDYMGVASGVLYEFDEHDVIFLKDFDDPAGDLDFVNEPEVSFTVCSLNGPADTLTTLNAADYTVEILGTTEPVTADNQTTYTRTYKVSRSDISKILNIRFIRINSEEVARTFLSYIRISDVRVNGFAMAINNYTYDLGTTVEEIPAVTYASVLPEQVTITDNHESVFDGISFDYIITVTDQVSQLVINTYTITFNRASSAIADALVLGSVGIYNFSGDIFYTPAAGEIPESGVQKAYVDSYFTNVDDINLLPLYPTTGQEATADCAIDETTHRITAVIQDTVSNVKNSYAIDQILVNEEEMLALNVNFGLVGEEPGTGYTLGRKDADSAYATDEEGYVDLGATGFIDINNFLAEVDTINPDGITLATWAKLPAAALNQWAGLMAVTSSGKNLIVNQSRVLTGDYGAGWNNEGVAAGSTYFVGDLYKHIVLEILPEKVVLYVDGAFYAEQDSSIILNAESDIGFGRSHIIELLGSGHFKNFQVYNAPLPVTRLNTMFSKMTDSLLQSLKFAGQTTNVTGFSAYVLDYDLTFSSAVAAPVASDFPALVATNGLGEIAAANITASAIDGKSITYTILSEANGFSNYYTVEVTLANNDTQIEKIGVLYSGEEEDFTEEIEFADFTLTDGKMVATVKVWKDADISNAKFIFSPTVKAGQSFENQVRTATSYSVDVYAEDGTLMTYLINFEEDSTIPNPDGAPKTGCQNGCAGNVNSTGLLIGAILAVMFIFTMLFSKKRKASTNK